ncbi:MAG: AAA family ATPase [Patescibacteria group bacterium]|jgi:dephospho-CoA kinase
MSKIYAVVGMCGSGKSEITKYLKEKYSCPVVYLGEITFDRLKKEGLEVNEKNERYAREKIRAEGGMGAYALFSLPKIEEALKNSDKLIIESLYSWDEYKILKEKYQDNFMVIAAICSPSIRHNRMANRLERPYTEEEARSRDWAEIENSDKGGPIVMADYPLLNDSDLKNLHSQIDKLNL